jgi:hypothetical protein
MEVINKIIDPEEEPDMVAYNVDITYSDSARLQMKLTSPFVKQFTEAKEPRDEFPEGLHVWFFEKDGETRGEITANWAMHDRTTNIWEARSNVVIISSDGRKIENEQMFWDQEKGEVYSNISTKITFPNGSIQVGKKGIWALQDFSDYRLREASGPIKFNTKQPETE